MTTDAFRARLVRFYEHHQPDKLGDVEKLLAKTQGKPENEQKLIDALVDKYGPEPMVSDPEALRARIRAFYKHYNPDKLNKVDNLVTRTKGKANYEERLMAMLIEKYGDEPEHEEGEAGATGASAAKASKNDDDDDDDDDDDESDEEEYTFHSRVVRFYKKYAPEKISDVDKLVERTRGIVKNEEKLMTALIDKYGPEPDSADEDEDDDSGEEAEDDFDELVVGKPVSGQMILTKEDSHLREIVYCPVDGMPPEYCEYLPTFKAALPWLEERFPDLQLTTKKGKTVAEVAAQIRADGGELGDAASAVAASKKRGGAGMPNKQHASGAGGQDKTVTIERSQRQRRKFVTSVVGLDAYDIKLKDAAKKLGRRFACGSTVNKLPNGKQSIDIQGDYIYDMPDLILEYFPSVDKSSIVLIDGGKKSKAF
ncbi:Translation machinery-associated protein 22 [Hondaea fermentalgiana]|uniref:Translation machinery-associated protein 22 n=1 Tax=Hondaea fermentalgiana TaxID=2315210 RepID=A0A2R5H0D2_9STRA|nr:Translation machinery-associated protein 22 [Hondaea fermentalgiana]|eukprot:GBG33774.1 Translation machinery-associated protein 22 [Hondaea fermentalgiana]